MRRASVVMVSRSPRKSMVATSSGPSTRTLVAPQGAFYAFTRVRPGLTSEQWASTLLAERGVAVVPGDAFGDFGAGFVRLSYACSRADIAYGLQAMRELAPR